VLVGSGGFKGRPDPDGSVEIGYSMVEEFQGRGYATEAVRALAAWAFAHPGVSQVVAETMPGNTGSLRVLEKIGFRPVDGASEPGALRFALCAVKKR
jgi:RimJ/RimL family protein N-acetyltransferase